MLKNIVTIWIVIHGLAALFALELWLLYWLGRVFRHWQKTTKCKECGRNANTNLTREGVCLACLKDAES